MPYCSIQRIEISDKDGNYPGTVVLEFGDQMDEEVSFTPNVLSQDSTAIDSEYAVVHGRGNKSQTISWSRTRTASTPHEARRNIFDEIAAIPGNTIAARIFYEDDPLSDVGDPYSVPSFMTYRCRVEAYPGKPVSGLDYTISYSLVWQFETTSGGGAPPPSDFRLFTSGGDAVFSSRSPQILIFH